VEDLAEQLDTAEGIRRKGLVLSFLMRFKQICNHPSQWLGDGAWSEAGQRQVGTSARHRRSDRRPSGEGAGLHAISRVTAPLAAFLGSIFGRPGWCCMEKPR
jgi:hypothetical protein